MQYILEFTFFSTELQFWYVFCVDEMELEVWQANGRILRVHAVHCKMSGQ